MSEPRIYTKCPACGNDTLTINDDKHLLCTWIDCPNPILIDNLWQWQLSQPAPTVAKNEPRVVCAACRSKTTGQIVCGARHLDSIMRAIMFPNGKREGEWQHYDQGFIDQFDNFLTRKEAWMIAEKQNQLYRKDGNEHGILYSENLY